MVVSIGIIAIIGHQKIHIGIVSTLSQSCMSLLRASFMHQKKGTGLVNTLINKLPIELHVPGYQYCGPFTKLIKRLARGDSGINPLDTACKEHDIAYLAEKTWQKVKSRNAGLKEKATAFAIANTMKLKSKLGLGVGREGVGGGGRRRSSKLKKTISKKKITLKKLIKSMGKPIIPGNDPRSMIKSALKMAREHVKNVGGKTRGDSGINPLDTACKEHDIAYLAEKAWQKMKSRNTGLKEKATAFAIANTMKLKSKHGLGVGREGVGGGGRSRSSKLKKTISKQKIILKNLIKSMGKPIIPGKDSRSMIKSELKMAREHVKNVGGKSTKLAKRLARGDSGINPLDAACKEHDIAYSKNPDNIQERNVADQILAEKAWQRVKSRDAGLKEKATAFAIANTMKLKSKLGLGVGRGGVRGGGRRRSNKLKKTISKKKITLKKLIKSMGKPIIPGNDPRSMIKSALKMAREHVKNVGGKSKVNISRIMPVHSEVGGFLPALILLFAGLSAVGSLAGGAAGIAKAINKASAAKKQMEEQKRHNEKIEMLALGKGLFLKPHRKGFGIFLKKKNKKLPKRALIDYYLLKYVNLMNIPNFRGVFMRNALPLNGCQARESAVINLNDASGPGTHWVAYRKIGNEVTYFDSFGDLQPPRDLMNYWKVSQVTYNYQSLLKMVVESMTLSLSCTSSILEMHYLPPIELDSDKQYSLGLIELLTFNSIPNVDENCNKFYVGQEIIELPTGSYEIEDIDRTLQGILDTRGIKVSIKPNNNTLRSVMCSHETDFRPTNSIGRLLGFTPRLFKLYISHNSDLPVAILKQFRQATR
ncbi:hypothetical protein TSAR_013133 [Trichomalopsis sarcophagae]|uniref:Phospholipase A2-like domain-containing protein n=1 Tax=Trichomalopsis sarcophagae TaxID=543379 RepID=A0A232EE69_9HYME|nr:hypothetical protein TSAR_013133 [Trichomalopsis sarcophagae]